MNINENICLFHVWELFNETKRRNEEIKFMYRMGVSLGFDNTKLLGLSAICASFGLYDGNPLTEEELKKSTSRLKITTSGGCREFLNKNYRNLHLSQSICPICVYSPDYQNGRISEERKVLRYLLSTSFRELFPWPESCFLSLKRFCTDYSIGTYPLIPFNLHLYYFLSQNHDIDLDKLAESFFRYLCEKEGLLSIKETPDVLLGIVEEELKKITCIPIESLSEDVIKKSCDKLQEIYDYVPPKCIKAVSAGKPDKVTKSQTKKINIEVGQLDLLDFWSTDTANMSSSASIEAETTTHIEENPISAPITETTIPTVADTETSLSLEEPAQEPLLSDNNAVSDITFFEAGSDEPENLVHINSFKTKELIHDIETKETEKNNGNDITGINDETNTTNEENLFSEEDENEHSTNETETDYISEKMESIENVPEQELLHSMIFHDISVKKMIHNDYFQLPFEELDIDVYIVTIGRYFDFQRHIYTSDFVAVECARRFDNKGLLVYLSDQKQFYFYDLEIFGGKAFCQLIDTPDTHVITMDSIAICSLLTTYGAEHPNIHGIDAILGISGIPVKDAFSMISPGTNAVHKMAYYGDVFSAVSQNMDEQQGIEYSHTMQILNVLAKSYDLSRLCEDLSPAFTINDFMQYTFHYSLTSAWKEEGTLFRITIPELDASNLSATTIAGKICLLFDKLHYSHRINTYLVGFQGNSVILFFLGDIANAMLFYDSFMELLQTLYSEHTGSLMQSSTYCIEYGMPS